MNAIYYDYGNGAADLIIQDLEKLGKYKFPVWIDNVELFNAVCAKEQREAVRLPDYSWHKLREGDVSFYEYQAIDRNLQQAIYEKYFYKYTLQASREDIKAHTNVTVYKDRTQFSNSTIYAQQNIFFVLMNFYYQLIKKHDIKMVYFNDIMHDGSDVVLYALASELNLKIFIAHRTILYPEKFFCLNTSNFTDYINLPSLRKIKPYVNTVKGKAKPAYKLSPSVTIVKPDTIDDYIKVKYFRMKPKKYLRYLRRMLRIMFMCRSTNQKESIFSQLRAITDYLNYNRYIKNLTSMQEDTVDFNSKFVFFPLHMQPEATTLAMETQYFDQLLALEAITDLLPDDWTVYVKDHYLSQREFMRDESFWVRLKGIKKVKLLSREIDTFELIERAEFVATIVGTAGFESLLIGKRVLIFGDAWYKHFTGACLYHDKLTLGEILNVEIDDEKLCYDIGVLESKMYEGTTDSDYGVFFDNYDLNTNREKRVKSLLAIFEGANV